MSSPEKYDVVGYARLILNADQPKVDKSDVFKSLNGVIDCTLSDLKDLKNEGAPIFFFASAGFDPSVGIRHIHVGNIGNAPYSSVPFGKDVANCTIGFSVTDACTNNNKFHSPSFSISIDGWKTPLHKQYNSFYGCHYCGPVENAAEVKPEKVSRNMVSCLKTLGLLKLDCA